MSHRTYGELFQQYTSATPEIGVDALAAIHALDLDTIVPIAKGWPTDWRLHAELLLHAAGEVLRGLVAEVVILDRELAKTEAELERSKIAARVATEAATEAVQAAEARFPMHRPDSPPIASAARVAYQAALALTPAPVTISLDAYENTPSVHLFGASAVTQWADQLGRPVVVEETERDGSTRIKATIEVDGVRVEMFGTGSRPAAAPELESTQ
ncbi:hypothetical protein ACFYS8_13255 [Kitasatospora sp. NPDC004615]|uniref:hypothetical protein n=1 Tax=unclassified Kitasatospora TaxID=2633591 RepID=UPI0036969618